VSCDGRPAGAGQPVVAVGNAQAGERLAAAFRQVPGIVNVTEPRVAAGHAYLEGTLTVPPDSEAAGATIVRARAALHAVPGADAMVGGGTAINLDVQRAAAHDSGVIIR
jgi:putative drug exporter of the RND superfamily